MTLVLKPKPSTEKEISLVDVGDEILAEVDGNEVASFFKDGKFKFYGQKGTCKYEGRWDK